MSDRQGRNCIITTWGVSDATLGKAGLCSIIALGSAAANVITILDGTAVKAVLQVGITANASIVLYPPAAFTNLIVDNSGTAAFSVVYQPTT